TRSSLTISNIDLVHVGAYFVIVSNAMGSVTSSIASLAVFLPDMDGDGLSDRWEKANGTDPAVPDAIADPDGDGLNNLQEFLAGTSPTNALSVLKLDSAMSGGPDFIFSFTAISNHSYTIQSQPALGGTWRKVRDLVAVSTNRTVWQTNSMTGTNLFFRLLTPLIEPADSDGDGLPDSWETANGTDPLTDDGNADPDNDHFTNFQEYLAGTIPSNATSLLKIESWAIADGNLILSFTSRSNRAYIVETSSERGNGAWQKWQDIGAAASDQTVWLTNSVSTNGSRFYRLVIPAQP
ncbi:MAG TPA: thrombospondin type 3 repeat-containing protein, partial [Candidatus Paceibacterota bacterium]|nr:thrombospondin type 3 repeat-containing protein [Candidatus Paceibacterota bacterium]